MNSRFALDRQQARICGVCAGLARLAGWDPLLVRMGVIASLLVLGPVTLLAYLVLALLADRD